MSTPVAAGRVWWCSVRARRRPTVWPLSGAPYRARRVAGVRLRVRARAFLGEGAARFVGTRFVRARFACGRFVPARLVGLRFLAVRFAAARLGLALRLLMVHLPGRAIPTATSVVENRPHGLTNRAGVAGGGSRPGRRAPGRRGRARKRPPPPPPPRPA